MVAGTRETPPVPATAHVLLRPKAATGGDTGAGTLNEQLLREGLARLVPGRSQVPETPLPLHVSHPVLLGGMVAAEPVSRTGAPWLSSLSASVSERFMSGILQLAFHASCVAILADAQSSRGLCWPTLWLLLAGRPARAPRYRRSCRRQRPPPAGRTPACGSTATQGRIATTKRRNSARRGRAARVSACHAARGSLGSSTA